MNTDDVTREEWIVAGLALLLAIALLFFPWFHLSITIGSFSTSADYSATSTPDGWLGILALIAAVLILADIAVERLSPDTEVPAIRGSRTETRFILAAIAAGLIVLKFLFHVHFDLFGWGFYVTIIVAGVLVYYTMQQREGATSYAGGTSRPGTGATSRQRPNSAPSDTGGGPGSDRPAPSEGSGTTPNDSPRGSTPPAGT